MHFQLKHYKPGTPAAIFLAGYISGSRFKYPIKESVDPAVWENGRTKDRRINVILARVETFVSDITSIYADRSERITAAELRKELDIFLNRVPAERKAFYETVDRIISDREEGRVLHKGKRFSRETIKGYRHTRDLLYRYDPKLTFDQLNHAEYERIIQYFTAKNYATNSIGKVIKNLKVFAGAARKLGIHANEAYETFHIPEEKTFDIYLTDREITRIYNHNFPNKVMAQVRDWFIIDCFTGLRISDIKLLEKKNIKSGTLWLANEKTDTTVIIPLHKYVREIIKRYGGLPPKVSDQEMNRELKKIGELAGINSPVLYSVTEGGVRKDYHFVKYQMMSCHTARRSFITNLLKAGISHIEVMKLAGVKKLATIQRYYKESELEIANRLKGHKFFR